MYVTSPLLSDIRCYLSTLGVCYVTLGLFLDKHLRFWCHKQYTRQCFANLAGDFSLRAPSYGR